MLPWDDIRAFIAANPWAKWGLIGIVFLYAVESLGLETLKLSQYVANYNILVDAERLEASQKAYTACFGFFPLPDEPGAKNAKERCNKYVVVPR